MKKKKKRGSITVEASVILPVFLCLFLLLLYFVKISLINLSLDYAANETAKEIAQSCYGVSILNSVEDDYIKATNYEYKTGKYAITKAVGDKFIEGLVSGKFSKDSMESVKNILGDANKTKIDKAKDLKNNFLGSESNKAKAIKNVAAKAVKNKIVGRILDMVGGYDKYWEWKSQWKYSHTSKILKKYIDDAVINPDNLTLIVEMPNGLQEFQAKVNDLNYYTQSGLKPGDRKLIRSNSRGANKIDFDKNDVVVQLKYNFDISIPFFGKKNVETVHTAVEGAWVLGSNGTITVWDEGLSY